MAKNVAAAALHAKALAGEKVTLDWMEQPDNDPAPVAAPDPMKAMELQIAELKGQISAATQGQKPNVIAGYEPRPNLQLEIDMSKLPDIETDAKGYATALAQQTQAVTQNRQEMANWAKRQEETTKKAADKLFNDFKKGYGDYAKSRKAVEVFAEECAEEAVASRKDVAHYMFGTPEVFFKDIVTKMDEAGFGPKVAPKEGEEEEDNRALGIPGETAGGKTAKVQANEENPSMMRSLSSWQQKTGFHP
jgi:hypothetical protein